MGPRRVGKTVMVHHAIQRLLDDGVRATDICYFSVDHPIYGGLDLEQFLEYFRDVVGRGSARRKCYAFFDEIQYLKNWERYLKAIIDHYPNLRCTVSGSAAAALRLKSTESGAGRFTEFLLPPLTFHEYLDLLGRDNVVAARQRKGKRGRLSLEVQADDLDKLNEDFLRYINFGGYPEAAFSPEIQSDPSRFIKSDIIDKVLLRDLPSLYGIQDIQELNYLFSTLAFNTASEVSLEGLAQGSGVAKNTIKRYIEYLQAAFLLQTVHRVDINARRFRRANYFKVYLTNPSMRSALFTPVGPDDENVGSLVETAIYSQWFHADETKLHYARWSSGEVDIVNVQGKDQRVGWAVEVKWSDKPYRDARELKNLIRFCHANNLSEAHVTTRTASGIKRFQSIDFGFVPASLYCYELGRNLVHGKLREPLLTLAADE